jgi:hypothetical protein
MKTLAHSKAIGALLIALVVISMAGASAGAKPAVPAPPAPQPVEGGPPLPIVVRYDPTPSDLRVPPPREFSQLRIQSATITVNYLAGGTTDVFGNDCYTWPSDAQTAFNYAASIWESLINSSVPIKIDACWTELGSGILGVSSPADPWRDFSGAPVANTWYFPALANALSGSDLNGTTAELYTSYSRAFSWYFGTDGNPGSQVDFASVVLHEICHGLGFAGSMTVSGGLGYWGWNYYDQPAIYDRFTEQGGGGTGTPLLSYANGSTALASALTSQDVFFDGTNANAANGGSPPELYAPSTWRSGSSYSHLDESYNGTVNALMTYSIGSGESEHDPGPVASGMLKDMGWTMSSASAPTVTGITPSSGFYTETVHITNLAGTNFQSGATVKLTKSGQPDINATSVNVESQAKITCDFNLSGAATGGWNVVVTNPDAQSGTLTNGFTVRAPGADIFIYLPILLNGYPPPQTVTFYPDADATVFKGDPDTNYGSETRVTVGYDRSGCSGSVGGGVSRGLVSFDLSSIPASATISDAKLHLYFVTSCYYYGHSQDRTVTTYRADADWSESSVTWNNRPGYAEAYGSASVGVTYSGLGWHSFDVTDLVGRWVNGSFSNHGLMVRAPETSGSDFARLQFYSRDRSGTSYDPYLEVTYVGMAASEQEGPTVEEVHAPNTCGPAYRRGLITYPSPSGCDLLECVMQAVCSPD